MLGGQGTPAADGAPTYPRLAVAGRGGDVRTEATVRPELVELFRGLIAAGRYDPKARLRQVFRLVPDPVDLAVARNRRWRAAHREQWLAIQHAYYRVSRQRPDQVARQRAHRRASYLRHREERLAAIRAERAAKLGRPPRAHKPYAPYRCGACGLTGHTRKRCAGESPA